MTSVPSCFLIAHIGGRPGLVVVFYKQKANRVDASMFLESTKSRSTHWWWYETNLCFFVIIFLYIFFFLCFYCYFFFHYELTLMFDMGDRNHVSSFFFVILVAVSKQCTRLARSCVITCLLYSLSFFFFLHVMKLFFYPLTLSSTSFLTRAFKDRVLSE